ncbi:hypothetical protein GCM10011510_09350 [Streptococcus himalayensis]|uniref:Uncharacterized protein n=1 Tax=Streptococcus himalayensis TaxID=1888195 RepID=A0A917A8A3_9STRE|nr:hypothetical protein GCM10011510_09350 [Streptococcus himalayensis]
MIERWLQEGILNREIVGRLAKAPQTIHNEVKRGQVRQQVRKGKFEMLYSADFTQEAYQNNRKHSVKQASLDYFIILIPSTVRWAIEGELTISDADF